MAQLIAITGAPHSGKSTLVRELDRLGYSTCPETALAVIEELDRALGREGQVRFRTERFLEFQRLVLDRQVEQEQSIGPDVGPVFLDRGRLDVVAFARWRGLRLPSDLEEAAAAASYQRVFLLDIVLPYDPALTGRTTTLEGAEAIQECLLEVYSEAGYDVTRVRLARVELRLAALLGELDPDARAMCEGYEHHSEGLRGRM